MTKLASIQRILSIDPIPGADKIELATILGWQIVVKKDEYKVGDLCIYIQIDTVIKPNKKWSSFLIEKNDPNKPVRIKTRRFRGQISQGLCLPLSILDEY